MLKKTDKKMSIVEAMTQAQKMAFSPIVFQAVRTAWKLGLLQGISDFGEKGASVAELIEQVDIERYGILVLLDILENADVVRVEDEAYTLTKLGDFILYDPMTQVNFNFTNDVCYQAAFHLLDSIETGRPVGLNVFGEYKSIYQALQYLPEPAKKSWFDFDHFYSDRSFSEALDQVFKSSPAKILDIGGNTGKWAIKCLTHDPDVKVVIADLPGQLNVARKNISDAGFEDRVEFWEVDILSEGACLYQGVDVVWMSQFLDCFSEPEITKILRLAKQSLLPEGRIIILELFTNRQTYEAAEYSLNATSLYFTFLANGNSRMYSSDLFVGAVEAAGLEITTIEDKIGYGHSLLICS